MDQDKAFRPSLKADFDDMDHHWHSQLEGSEAPQFPTIQSPTYQPKAIAVMKQHFQDIRWMKCNYMAAVAVYSAWALLQARYTSTAEVVFGTVLAGRQAPAEVTEPVAGTRPAMVPVILVVDIEATVQQLLEQVQEKVLTIISFQRKDSHQICALNKEMGQRSLVQSLVVVRPQKSECGKGECFDERPVELSFDGDNDCDASYNHALFINCQLESDGLNVQMNYDAAVVHPAQAQRIMAQFEHILRQVTAAECADLRLEELQIVSPSDLKEIWTWNATDFEVVNGCVHDVLAKTIARQPKAPAVCAWDGELTYADLDLYSTRLAHRLVGLGVRPNTIVPICMEKSMWMAVAILGVMKAGGASVALDATLPHDRLQQVTKQVDAKLVVSSKVSEVLASQLNGATTVVTEEASLAPPGPGAIVVLPKMKPSDTLYIVFTSGSTGVPKGLVVTHANFCSAFVYQPEALGFKNSSRVFEFASYAFDVVWTNFLHTIYVGGCICTPSESDRRGNIAQVMRKLNVNFADLTPTVARLLDPTELPGLETLLLAGEAVMAADAEQWKSVPILLDTYGPAENTVKSVIGTIDPNTPGDPSIGRGIGGNTWLVDPLDYTRLVPIGCVGELVFDGPLVIEGYLNDPEKTAAAFIEDPPWLLQGASGTTGRRGRVYLTGDMVRYRPDGSLDYLGRKDDQVKLRGQRIELGEVEHHVRRLLRGSLAKIPSMAHAAASELLIVAEVVKLPGTDGKTLMAFVVPPGAATMTEAKLEDVVHQLTHSLNGALEDVVPQAMIPAGYIPLAAVPVSPSGKTDRGKLRRFGASLDLSKFTAPDLGQTVVASSGPIEQLLCAIWAQVLNIPTDSISVEAAFARLGGDSITAMQVVSRCRAQSISLTVADVLELQTIRRVATRCQLDAAPSVAAVEEDNDCGKGWPLSPVQKMFLDANSGAPNHCNQSFILKTRTHLSIEKIHRAVLEVVQRHQMLRARFRRLPDRQWEQFILPFHPTTVLFEEHFLRNKHEVEHQVQSRQRSLDIEQGPIFAVDVFQEHEEGQVVLLSAHHLVIDLVSWRVIWHDLQECLNGSSLSGSTMSFRKWCAIQQKEGERLTEDEVLPFTPEQPHFDYWGLSQVQNVIGATAAFVEHLDIETTELLLSRSNGALGTETADILVAMMDFTFRHVFSDRTSPPIFFEGHGREPVDGVELDISETVGWFTTFHPLQLSCSPDASVTSTIEKAKAVRRLIPGKGRPYSARQRYCLAEQSKLLPFEDMEVLLIYTGRFQQLEDNKSWFQLLDNPINFPPASTNIRRFGLIEVTVEVKHGRMSIEFSVNKDTRHQERLREWATAFAEALYNVAHTLGGSTKMCV